MRFTIRDVLWLTVVVALLATLWIDRRRLDSARRAAEDDAIKATERYGKLLDTHALEGWERMVDEEARARQTKN